MERSAIESKESKDERRWNEGTTKEKEKKNRRMIRCDRTGKGDDGMKHHRKIEGRKRNEGIMKEKEKKNRRVIHDRKKRTRTKEG